MKKRDCVRIPIQFVVLLVVGITAAPTYSTGAERVFSFDDFEATEKGNIDSEVNGPLASWDDVSNGYSPGTGIPENIRADVVGRGIGVDGVVFTDTIQFQRFDSIRILIGTDPVTTPSVKEFEKLVAVEKKEVVTAPTSEVVRLLIEEAKTRTWRDQETVKAVSAILVAIEGDMITLQISDGREFTLSVSRFHKDDQAYVAEMKADKLEMDKFDAERAKLAGNGKVDTAKALMVKPDVAASNLRTYTDGSGNKIQAEVLSVNDGTVSMMLSDKRTFEIPLEKLSGADQQFITAWAEKNPNFGLKEMRLDVRKFRKKGEGSGNTKTYLVAWKGQLHNDTREVIPDVQLKYTVYKRKSSRGAGATDNVVGKEEHVDNVGSLSGGISYEFNSKEITETFVTVKTDRSKKIEASASSDTIEGVVFSIKVREREFVAFTEPPGFLDRLETELQRKEEMKERKEARQRD
jgi:hypothetical protein